MLFDFLADCGIVLNDEKSDYQEAADRFAGRDIPVGLLPAITTDLYPVYALSCTSAARLCSPEVYLCPLGAHGASAKYVYEDVVDRFYRDDELKEQYQTELEEMILLRSGATENMFLLNGEIPYNVIYCELAMPNGKTVYLLGVFMSPGECWKKIIEPYRIRCDIVIDSHKGMGDWFDSIPLYRFMRETGRRELLPRYYFRGLYALDKMLPGFRPVYTIPETITDGYHNKPIENERKEICEIDWEANTAAGS